VADRKEELHGNSEAHGQNKISSEVVIYGERRYWKERGESTIWVRKDEGEGCFSSGEGNRYAIEDGINVRAYPYVSKFEGRAQRGNKKGATNIL